MQNRITSTTLSLLLLGSTSLAFAGVQSGGPVAPPATQSARDIASGRLRAVTDDSFTLTTSDGTALELGVDDSTIYELDGEEARQGQVLVKGNRVEVTHADGVASKVSMTTELLIPLEETRGTVREVGESSFRIETQDGETKSFELAEDATFELDGEPARMGQVLVPNKDVLVIHEDGVAGQVSARSQAAPAPAISSGSIREVREDGFVLVLEGGETLDIQIDDDTAYELDGEAARRDQVLVQGQDVKVTHEDNVASKVAARS